MRSTLYVTPSTIPATFQCRRVRMPDDPLFFAAVMGALYQLTYASNWVQTTGVSTSAAAGAALVMYDDCVASLGACLIGQVTLFAGDEIPADWLECDGTTYLRTTYPALYAALGDAFHVDADHFVVPDMRGRVPVGVDAAHTSPPFDLGETGGEETHTLVTAETPSHSHTDAGHNHTEVTATPTAILIGAGAPAPSALPGVGITGTGTASIQPTGGDGGHNNLQPYLVLRYIIQAL